MTLCTSFNLSLFQLFSRGKQTKTTRTTKMLMVITPRLNIPLLLLAPPKHREPHTPIPHSDADHAITRADVLHLSADYCCRCCSNAEEKREFSKCCTNAEGKKKEFLLQGG